MILGIILGFSITLNLVCLIILKIVYSKLIKNNPLSSFNQINNKKTDEVIDKIKKFNMEDWDI